MEIVWVFVVAFFPLTCGLLWGYFIARGGRSWAWRISIGLIGAVLWAVVGFNIDHVVYRWMQSMLGGVPDWQGVIGVYFVAAGIVILFGLFVTMLLPPVKLAANPKKS